MSLSAVVVPLFVFICAGTHMMDITSNKYVITKSVLSELKAVVTENLNMCQWCGVHILIFQIL